MKIFYSAVFDNEGVSSDSSKARELEALGNLVVSYNYRVRSQELGSHERDQEIIKFCSDWHPDLIIFSKCNGINILVFEECKKIAPVCYWFADPLITFLNEEFYAKTKIADFFMCDKGNVLEQAKKLNSNVFLVADGFDRLLEKPKNVEEEYDVSFIGNLYGGRGQKFKQISHKVSLINDAFATKHSEHVSKSKINLNFCTSAGPSDRVFKVLGAGGFLLTDKWVGMEDQFEDKKDLVVFKNIQDLNKKIQYYLEHPEKRKEIAKSGHIKVQKFTRENWAKNTIQIFKDFNFLKRQEKKKETVLLAGPWVGEFGWELFAWQGYIRSLSRFYDKTVCISSKYSKFLYEDFCDDYVDFFPEGSGDKDSFYKINFSVDGSLINQFIKSLNLDVSSKSVSFFIPRRIGDPPRTHFGEKIQLGMHYLSPIYKKPAQRKITKNIVVHARNRGLRSDDNWDIKKWEILVDKFKLEGYNIISIGLKDEAMHIDDTVDMRECTQDDLVDILSNATASLGPSSGAMHLASLCGCPHVVWSTDYNLTRYTKNWNPFDTRVLFLSEHGWDPTPEFVFERFTNWINKTTKKNKN